MLRNSSSCWKSNEKEKEKGRWWRFLILISFFFFFFSQKKKMMKNKNKPWSKATWAIVHWNPNLYCEMFPCIGLCVAEATLIKILIRMVLVVLLEKNQDKKPPFSTPFSLKNKNRQNDLLLNPLKNLKVYLIAN